MLPTSHCYRVWLLAILLFSSSVLAQQGRADQSSYAILPSNIELWHADSTQQVLLQSRDAKGQHTEPVLEGIQWKSSDPKIFQVDTDRIRAIGNGSATLSAWRDGREVAQAMVTVRQAQEPMEWEFRNHVQSVLARHGCNMGACHGALAGKGGFRLSLRGYDALSDHFNITRQDRGRRIELANPAESLLLTKPSGMVPHKGGVRLPSDSPDYAILSDWIARGAPAPTDNDPKLVKIEVQPEEVQLAKNQIQPLLVRAHYSNGRIEDVTRWSKFSSTDDAVINVDERGTMKVVGPGQASVVVWFASRVVMARSIVPFEQSVPAERYAATPVANFIDQCTLDQLQQLHLAPSPRCEDGEFIRRVYLDTIGMLPTAEVVQAFVEENAPNKRARLIDELLERPEYVDYWAYRWSDLLLLNGNLLRPDPIKTYYEWIRGHVQRNTAWDQMVREIVTARGDSLANGATNFYALHQDPESMTENACQAFLGLSIGCAKCHNHPLEKWTNDQYYAMANLFARVRGKGWGGDGRDGDGKRTVVVLDRGDLIQPITGKPQPPAPLDATPLDADDTHDRRLALAEWMVSPENPYFTKAIVNRVWANFFGIGIVNAVDDLRVSNPPTNPQLMQALERSLIQDRYDLKALMRRILNSETYQRSSLAIPENQHDTKYFSRYYPKRLMAEVLHDAICQITAVPTKFTEIEYLGTDKKPTNFYPAGTRAVQLYDSAVRNYFLKTFGRNQRRITCECERSDEPSVVQVLHLSNGDTLNQKLSEKGNALEQLLGLYGDQPEELIRVAYWQCLGREAKHDEREALRKELSQASAEDKKLVLEDLYWSLMTSREFLFNH
ncbi:MAG: DUF1553 domain-containing protein [Pirellulales bacterium]